jgi:hypothetical protein
MAKRSLALRFGSSTALIFAVACGSEGGVPSETSGEAGHAGQNGGPPEPSAGAAGAAGAASGGTSGTTGGTAGQPPNLDPELIDLLDKGATNEDATVDDALDGRVLEPVELIKANARIAGITSDDRVVYRDTDGLFSIKAAPGAPRRVAAVYPGTVHIKGRAIFTFTQEDWGSGQGALSVWTPHVGVRQVGKAAIGEANVQARRDGRYLLFALNVSEASLDIVAASSDLAVAQVIVKGAGRGGSETCRPSFGFANENALVAYCEPGSTEAKLVQLRVGEDHLWTPEVVAEKVGTQFAADESGETLFYIDRRGHGYIRTQSSTTKLESNVTWGMLTHDGETLFYTVGDQLRRRTDSGPAIPVVTTGFTQSAAWTQDASFVLYSRTIEYAGVAQRDLYLTGTEWFNPEPRELVGQPVARLSRSAFTRDGRFALYMTDVNDAGAGTLHAYPTAGGSGFTMAGVDTVLAAAGSTVLVSDGRSEPGSWPMLADLKKLSLDSGTPPSVVKGGIVDGRSHQVTEDGTRVVYVAGAPQQAIYLHPLD